MDPIIYTNATITTNDVPNIVHIESSDPVNNIVIILTQQEFTYKLKHWLRTLPEERRQLILDELIACTLRTLE